MTIIHVVENIDDRYGGPAKSIPYLCKYLELLGIKTIILSVKVYDNEKNTVIRECRLEWESFDSVGPKSFFFSWQLRDRIESLIRQDKDTIIHVHNSWTYTTWISSFLSRKHDIPLVMSVRGSMYPWSLNRSRFIKRVAWHLFQLNALNSASIIHTTEAGEKKCMDDLGIRAKKCIIPNGVEIFQGKKPTKKEAQAELGLIEGRRYLVFLSRIHPKKGLDVLVEAFVSLASDYPDWDMLVVGPESDELYCQRIKQSIEKSSLSNRIIFKGMLEGRLKTCAFFASELFVLPSYSENFGVSIAEAISFDLPVITTTATPWSEVEKFQSGWIIDPSFENLNRILRLAMSMEPSVLSDMGKRGAFFISNYNWGAQAVKMREVYLYILGKASQPDSVSS